MKTCSINAAVAIAFFVAGLGTQTQQTHQVEQQPTFTQQPATNSPEKGSKRKSVEIMPREELIAFVQQHHPELEELLIKLEEIRPDRYKAAVRSLSRSIRRIQALDGSDREKYDAVLRQWKIKSRINLAAVQLGIEDTPEHRQKLKKLIVQNVDLRKRQLEMEAKRLRKRLAAIDKQLVIIEEKRDQEIEKQIAAAREMVSRVRSTHPKNNASKNSKVNTDK